MDEWHVGVALFLASAVLHSRDAERLTVVTAVQVDVFTPLCAVVARVWALWELLMLAEPLMVVAPTPGALRVRLWICLVR